MRPSEDRTYRTKEFAQLAGVTVRALHHYDRLGLLKPKRTPVGYRAYSTRDLETLEQIIALKFIGVPLKKIRFFTARTPHGLANALRAQRQTLEEKKHLLDQAIDAIREVEAVLQAGKGADAQLYRRIIEVIEMQNNSDAWKKKYDILVQAKIERLKSLSPDALAELRRSGPGLRAIWRSARGALPGRCVGHLPLCRPWEGYIVARHAFLRLPPPRLDVSQSWPLLLTKAYPAEIRRPMSEPPRVAPLASAPVYSPLADEWPALMRRHPNLLISGPREATDAFVLALTPSFRLPIHRFACDALLTLPPAGGTLMLDGVEALDGRQQETLLGWLDEYSHAEMQVISIAPTALYPHVQAGTFLEALFYRLNVICVEVSSKTEAN
jgi:DNA-binding transcriptional MerR regulator